MRFRLLFLGLAACTAFAALLTAQAGLLLAAVGLAGLGFAGLDDSGDSAAWLERWWRRWLTVDPQGISALLVVGSVCFTGVAVVLSRTTRFSVLPWLLALGLLLAAATRLDGIRRTHLRHICTAPRRRSMRLELATVAAISLVALVLRAYQLEAYPPAFHGDEGELALIAREILKGQRFSLFGTSSFSSIPFMFSYLQAASMLVFGQGIVGARMVSVLFGVACVPAVYVLARIAWGPLAAAVAAWLLAVSHLHIQYSRMAISNVEATLTMILMMLLLAFAYEHGRRANRGDDSASSSSDPLVGRPGVWTALVLAGMAIGFAQYLYYAARVMPIVAAPLLIVLWRRRCVSLVQIGGLALGGLAVFAPLGLHYVTYPDTFFARVQMVSIFQASFVQQIVGPSATLPSALPALLTEQLRRVLSMFILAGDGGGFYFYNIPSFDTLTVVLLWLGMGATIAQWRRFHELTLLLWFWLGVLFGGVLTIDAPSGQRLLIMTPTVFLLGAMLVARVARMVGGTRFGATRWLLAPVGTSAALLLLAMNVGIYFFQYAPRVLGREATAIGQELAQEPSRYHAFMLTGPVLYENHGTIRFLARDVPIIHLNNRSEFRPPTDGKGVVVVALEHRIEDLRAIEAQIPGGTETRNVDPSGRLIYIAYRTPPTGQTPARPPQGR
ncbi:MAG: glycosyltransferase family 39 protein [Chloroflexi bacterium]|nr:glycosyltransferase family 39 protein [Chloroflexota bacterium]